MKIEVIVAISGIIVTVIASIASYFIGVRVGKVNEKRKEWNALVEPLLIVLEEQKRAYAASVLSKFDRRDYQFPYDRVNSIRRRLRGKSLECFNAKFAKYHQAKSEITQHTDKKYDEAIKAIDELIVRLNLR